MADMMFALGQTKKKKNEENKVRQTKKDLKDVNITNTIEKDIRKEQHEREQKWKATGRDQIKQNTNFDMARSLFGGGGPAPAADDSDDVVEEVVKKVEKVAIDDDEEDDEEGEQDYDEYEDVDEKDD